MRLPYTEFKATFQKLAKDNLLKVRYTKEREGEIIHKEMIVRKEGEKFYLKQVERKNDSPEITLDDPLDTYEELSEASLENKHDHIAALFASIDLNKEPKLSIWQDIKQADSFLKWLTCYFLLDTRLIGGLVGKIIAYSANKENPHYKTVASHILGKTLGPLIFPAGLKKPTLSEPGLVSIDSILHKQYKSVSKFDPKYHFETDTGQKKILFVHSHVKALASKNSQEKTLLDTLTASNDLVNEKNKNEHLHVIYFNGNSGCYQQEYKSVAQDLINYEKEGIPVTAVQFNYPGVLSKYKIRRSFELVLAGIAQVKALRDQGVPLNQITLHGVSLGGCIATLTARFLLGAGHPIAGVYASRTFASTTQVGRDFFNRALGNNYLSRIISTICLPFIHLGTKGSSWYLGTSEAFFSMPKYMRNYSVIITPRANREKFQKENKGNFFKQVKYFLLGKEDKPADDAILGRGLHDSWEKKLEGVKMKLQGKKARAEYSHENMRKKMLVINFNSGELEPKIDGHAKAHYCYQRPKGPSHLKFNPKKSDGSQEDLNNAKVTNIGLFHRSKPTTEVLAKGKVLHKLPVDGNEAGEIARQWLASAPKRAAAYGA